MCRATTDQEPPSRRRLRSGAPVNSLSVDISCTYYRPPSPSGSDHGGEIDKDSKGWERQLSLDDLEFSPRSEAIFQREVRKAVSKGAAMTDALIRSILTQHFDISYESEEEFDEEEGGQENCPPAPSTKAAEDKEERVFTFAHMPLTPMPEAPEPQQKECTCASTSTPTKLLHQRPSPLPLMRADVELKSIFCPTTPTLRPDERKPTRPNPRLRRTLLAAGGGQI